MKDSLPITFQYDGKFHRWGPKDRMWAAGREWVYKGNSYKILHHGDWKLGETSTWKSYDDKSASISFKKKEKEALEEIKLQVDFEKEKKHKDCSEFWNKQWELFPSPTVIHPYLQSKKISAPHGTKIDERGSLIIKIVDENGIKGVQKIFQTNEGFIKVFSTGIKKKGSFAHIGDYKNAEYVYVTEGFATGASVFEATNTPVVVALDSGNMFLAIITLRKLNSKCKIIICADVDKSGVGLKASKQCKAKILNVIVKVPKFTLKDDSLTDFNDLAVTEGIGNQLDFSDEDFLKIIPLGHADGNYFYTSNVNSQTIRIPSSGHNDKNLFQLAPFEYWKKVYSNGDKVNWVLVASDLMDKCHKVGIFDPEKIRGRGVWTENGAFVINDGKNTPQSSDYIYQKNIQRTLNTSNPYTNEEMQNHLAWFKKIIYKNPSDHIYLAGWVIQAQIFGALSWRFHVWLTGERGSGKSSLLEWISNMIPLSIISNDATQSGVRQKIGNDCTALLLDEVEPDSSRGEGLVELARHMSSNNGQVKLRGTPGGRSITYSGQCVMLFGSIQLAKFTAADASRIYIIELDKTLGRQTNDEYMTLKSGLNSIDHQRMFARAYQCLPSIKESFKEAKRYLTNKLSIESRLAEQISSALSCYHVFFSTAPMSETECANYIEDFSLLKSDFIEDNKESDTQKCFDDLMDAKVDTNPITTLAAAIELINRGTAVDYWNKILGGFGLRYYPEDKTLFVPSKNKRLLNEMGHYTNLATMLRRDKGMCVSITSVVKIFGLSVKGCKVKIS